MISRAKATAKMKILTDPAARATGDILLPTDKERLQRLNLHGQNKKEQSYKKMEEELNKMNNERAIVTAMNSRQKKLDLDTKRIETGKQSSADTSPFRNPADEDPKKQEGYQIGGRRYVRDVKNGR